MFILPTQLLRRSCLLGFLLVGLNVFPNPPNGGIPSCRELFATSAEALPRSIWSKFWIRMFGKPSKGDDGNFVKTEVRLSGRQSEQQTSVRSDLRLARQVIDQVNQRLARNLFVPETVFIHFDENIDVKSASISFFEMTLANESLGEASPKIIAAIVHEYFHLLLNRELAKLSSEYLSTMELKLQESDQSRREHRLSSTQHNKFELEMELMQTTWIIQQIQIMKDWGEYAFTDDRIDRFLREPILNLKQNGRFKDLTISIENADRVSELFVGYQNELQMKISRLVTILDAASTIKGEKSESTEFFNTNISSFYSESIHELWADLGSVLYARDPDIMSTSLDSTPRSFARNITLDEQYMEFLHARKYDPHILLSHGRSYIWLEFFTKIDQKYWPEALSKLAASFAYEILQNSPDVRTDPIVDYLSANIRVEQLIRETLSSYLP